MLPKAESPHSSSCCSVVGSVDHVLAVVVSVPTDALAMTLFLTLLVEVTSRQTPPPQRCVSVSHTDHVSSAFLLTSLHLQSCQLTSSLTGFGICKSTPQSRSQGRADSAGADNRFLHKPVFRRPAWMHHGQGEPFHNKVSVFK